jgi:predicted RNA-binding Zn-ribbon protein involved in translation (DUF1610 family)
MNSKMNKQIIQTEENEVINPCPKCGSEDVYVNEWREISSVYCADCSCKTREYTARWIAVNAWNSKITMNRKERRKRK